MARKKKEFNKDGPFQIRFRNLFDERLLTQNKLATALGVSRPTVAGWLNGDNIPDIQDFEKIARYFNVSADYLLGLSDTVSPDVSVRAAMAYTGLSEPAVERLHIGLDDSECDGIGISSENIKENQRTASLLIKDKAFTEMIYHLRSVGEKAYFERLLGMVDNHTLVDDSLDEDSDFFYASKADRELAATHLSRALSLKYQCSDDSYSEEVSSMTDDTLAWAVMSEFDDAREKSAVHQFHAAKAFTRFIDRLVKRSQRKAEENFNGE